MRKKQLFLVLMAGLALSLACAKIFAEEAKKTDLMTTVGSMNSDVLGVVGKVSYVDLKSKGESTIVLKNNKGESIEVSLQSLKDGATVLTTFRKEKDKKGKEKNVLISLSIIKPSQDSKTAGKKK